MMRAMQAVTNYEGNMHTVTTSDIFLPDRLSAFYARFDNPHRDTQLALPIPPCGPGESVLRLTRTQLLRSLQEVNPHKAAGPDGLSPRALKVC